MINKSPGKQQRDVIQYFKNQKVVNPDDKAIAGDSFAIAKYS